MRPLFARIKFRRRGRGKLPVIALLCLVMVVCFSGCQRFTFYRQAIAGQYQILAHQKSITNLMVNPDTPPELKAKFEQVIKIRRFAAEELKLPADGAYVKYTDLRRPYVVWNVTVAPALSLEPKSWWFPVVGWASYCGYFNEADARRYASRWEKKGWDVDVGGVTAYSTLGWFHDPLMNTFIYEPEPYLAELIFHELGHRRLFIIGDTDFNEAFATEVAAEGLRRWFAASPNPKAFEEHQAALAREKQFVQLVTDTRRELEPVYADAHLPAFDKLQRKEEIIKKLRSKYAAVKKAWGGDTSYDGWFAEPINNAKLATVSEYYDLVPAFQALLQAKGGDMEKFYEAVAALGKLPIQKRHAALQDYLKGVPPPQPRKMTNAALY
jgi:predicted aminopeptidase